ncbi:MAG: rRNA cytosine-C5-methyltransferase [Prevotellaceae bacterium]|jgi:16S rRNA C967 or C1407 C5-methylase (RsmB/RsmF family)|nr:rRNA cytosine-C5-methyltransferase [Prevotellaceae bacterium]
MEKFILPQAFIDRMKIILGDEYHRFEYSMREVPPVSIRLNSGIKLPDPKLLPDTQFSIFDSPFSVRWCKHGVYLAERPSFTLDPLFHAGSYYVQEAASMFLEQCVHTVKQYGEIDYILDLCAAPGGKSTHLISLFPDSLVVSNEVIRSRAAVLEENISKWGRANTMITSCDPAAFRKLGHFFDFILVDAPCSGEGMFRKDPETLKEWSSDNVKHCAARQIRIVRDVWDTLKPGGFMLYGTCTYNIEENENTIKFITENLGAESVPLHTGGRYSAKESGYEGIAPSFDKNIHAYRFFPHKTKSEGLFLSLIRKTSPSIPPHRGGGERHKNKKYSSTRLCERLGKDFISSWLNTEKDMFAGFPAHLRKGAGEEVFMFPEKFVADIEYIGKTIYTLSAGTKIGMIKGKDFIPSYDFAHSAEININNFTIWAVDRITALKFLKRETLYAPAGIGKGYILLTYLGVPIGWVKNIGARCNNIRF